MPAAPPTKAERKARKARRFKDLEQPLLCWAPTLYEEGRPGPPRFDTGCLLVLSALGDPQWDGRWHLNEQEESRLFKRIEAADNNGGAAGQLLPGFEDNEISSEEIVAFIQKDENWKEVQKMPKAVHGILNEDLVTLALKDFDADGSGKLSVEEWRGFLGCLEGLHLQFLLGQAFAAFRAYFGRGQRWRVSQVTEGIRSLSREDVCEMAGGTWRDGVRQKPTAFQVGRDPDGGLLPPGWAADLHYYVANNHPLYGILACDSNNPLSALERLAMELATLGFTTFCVAFGHWKERHHINTFGLGITVLSMVMWWTFFLLFTCPKLGRIDFSQPESGAEQVVRARTWAGAGATAGYMLLMAWLAFLGWVIFLKVHSSERMVAQVEFQVVFLKRAKSYIVSLALMVGVYFNPFVAWGQPDPTGKFNLGDYIGLGQWRIEKQRFQACCADLMERIPAGLPIHNIKKCGCSIS